MRTVLPFLPRFHRGRRLYIRDSQLRIISSCGRNIYFASYFHVTSLLTEHYVKKGCYVDDRASNRKKREKKQEKRPDKWFWNFQQPDCRSSYQKDSLKWKKERKTTENARARTWQTVFSDGKWYFLCDFNDARSTVILHAVLHEWAKNVFDYTGHRKIVVCFLRSLDYLKLIFPLNVYNFWIIKEILW